jgi:hypothetical protein
MTVALLVNNLHRKRRYPTYWWGAATVCEGVLPSCCDAASERDHKCAS